MMLTVTEMHHHHVSAVLDNEKGSHKVLNNTVESGILYFNTSFPTGTRETHLFCVCGEFRVLSSRGSLSQEVREQQSNTVEVTAEPGKYEHAQQSQ